MPRSALTLLIAVGLLLSARLGWTETASPAASTAAPTAVQAPSDDPTAAAPAATTAATPAAASTPAAQVTAAASPAASTASAPAAATAAAQTAAAAPAAPAPTPAAATPEPAPAPAAAPTETVAPAQPIVSGSAPQVPVRGMDMANVEHIFGTPLEKQDAVGKPPITRWVYSDYIVYFEYNKVLHTVMKAGPFADSKAPGNG